ncbi:MAG: hypothetical protein Q8R78_03460, partial [Candidatus Omnitrophota bacterium]|nr:hypothetical protein [Candidatus Omnitrophota bacterium]
EPVSRYIVRRLNPRELAQPEDPIERGLALLRETKKLGNWDQVPAAVQWRVVELLTAIRGVPPVELRKADYQTVAIPALGGKTAYGLYQRYRSERERAIERYKPHLPKFAAELEREPVSRYIVRRLDPQSPLELGRALLRETGPAGNWDQVPLELHWRLIEFVAEQLGVELDALRDEHAAVTLEALDDQSIAPLMQLYEEQRVSYGVPPAMSTMEFMVLKLRLLLGLPLDSVTSRLISGEELALLRSAARYRHLNLIAEHLGMSEDQAYEQLLAIRRRLRLPHAWGHTAAVDFDDVIRAVVRLRTAETLRLLLEGRVSWTDVAPDQTELEILYEAARAEETDEVRLIEEISRRTTIGTEAIQEEYVPSILRKMEIALGLQADSLTFRRAVEEARQALRRGRPGNQEVGLLIALGIGAGLVSLFLPVGPVDMATRLLAGGPFAPGGGMLTIPAPMVMAARAILVGALVPAAAGFLSLMGARSSTAGAAEARVFESQIKELRELVASESPSAHMRPRIRTLLRNLRRAGRPLFSGPQLDWMIQEDPPRIVGHLNMLRDLAFLPAESSTRKRYLFGTAALLDLLKVSRAREEIPELIERLGALGITRGSALAQLIACERPKEEVVRLVGALRALGLDDLTIARSLRGQAPEDVILRVARGEPSEQTAETRPQAYMPPKDLIVLGPMGRRLDAWWSDSEEGMRADPKRSWTVDELAAKGQGNLEWVNAAIARVNLKLRRRGLPTIPVDEPVAKGRDPEDVVVTRWRGRIKRSPALAEEVFATIGRLAGQLGLDRGLVARHVHVANERLARAKDPFMRVAGVTVVRPSGESAEQAQRRLVREALGPRSRGFSVLVRIAEFDEEEVRLLNTAARIWRQDQAHGRTFDLRRFESELLEALRRERMTALRAEGLTGGINRALAADREAPDAAYRAAQLRIALAREPDWRNAGLQIPQDINDAIVLVADVQAERNAQVGEAVKVLEGVSQRKNEAARVRELQRLQALRELDAALVNDAVAGLWSDELLVALREAADEEALESDEETLEAHEARGRPGDELWRQRASVLRQHVRAMADRAGFAADEAAALGNAAVYLQRNLDRHGAPIGVLLVRRLAKGLELISTDLGPGVKEFHAKAAGRGNREGGLPRGLAYVRQTMDRLRYVPGKPGATIIARKSLPRRGRYALGARGVGAILLAGAIASAVVGLGHATADVSNLVSDEAVLSTPQAPVTQAAKGKKRQKKDAQKSRERKAKPAPSAAEQPEKASGASTVLGYHWATSLHAADLIERYGFYVTSRHAHLAPAADLDKDKNWWPVQLSGYEEWQDDPTAPGIVLAFRIPQKWIGQRGAWGRDNTEEEFTLIRHSENAAGELPEEVERALRERARRGKTHVTGVLLAPQEGSLIRVPPELIDVGETRRINEELLTRGLIAMEDRAKREVRQWLDVLAQRRSGTRADSEPTNNPTAAGSGKKGRPSRTSKRKPRESQPLYAETAEAAVAQLRTEPPFSYRFLRNEPTMKEFTRAVAGLSFEVSVFSGRGVWMIFRGDKFSAPGMFREGPHRRGFRVAAHNHPLFMPFPSAADLLDLRRGEVGIIVMSAEDQPPAITVFMLPRVNSETGKPFRSRAEMKKLFEQAEHELSRHLRNLLEEIQKKLLAQRQLSVLDAALDVDFFERLGPAVVAYLTRLQIPLRGLQDLSDEDSVLTLTAFAKKYQRELRTAASRRGEETPRAPDVGTPPEDPQTSAHFDLGPDDPTPTAGYHTRDGEGHLVRGTWDGALPAEHHPSVHERLMNEPSGGQEPDTHRSGGTPKEPASAAAGNLNGIQRTLIDALRKAAGEFRGVNETISFVRRLMASAKTKKELQDALTLMRGLETRRWERFYRQTVVVAIVERARRLRASLTLGDGKSYRIGNAVVETRHIYLAEGPEGLKAVKLGPIKRGTVSRIRTAARKLRGQKWAAVPQYVDPSTGIQVGEFVEGATLGTQLRAVADHPERLIVEAARITLRLTGLVHDIQAQGVRHNDLVLDNVLATPRGDLVVVDWDSATVVEETDFNDLRGVFYSVRTFINQIASTHPSYRRAQKLLELLVVPDTTKELVDLQEHLSAFLAEDDQNRSGSATTGGGWNDEPMGPTTPEGPQPPGQAPYNSTQPLTGSLAFREASDPAGGNGERLTRHTTARPGADQRPAGDALPHYAPEDEPANDAAAAGESERKLTFTRADLQQATDAQILQRLESIRENGLLSASRSAEQGHEPFTSADRRSSRKPLEGYVLNPHLAPIDSEALSATLYGAGPVTAEFALFPILAERYGEAHEERLARSSEELTARMQNSVLIVMRTDGVPGLLSFAGLTGQSLSWAMMSDHVPFEAIQTVLVPEPLAALAAQTFGNQGIDVVRVGLVRRPIVHMLATEPTEFWVPDYEMFLKGVDHPVVVHGVRLPTLFDVARQPHKDPGSGGSASQGASISADEDDPNAGLPWHEFGSGLGLPLGPAGEQLLRESAEPAPAAAGEEGQGEDLGVDHSELKPGAVASGVKEESSSVQATSPTEDQGHLVSARQHGPEGEPRRDVSSVQELASDLGQGGVEFSRLAGDDASQGHLGEPRDTHARPQRERDDGVRSTRIDERRVVVTPARGLSKSDARPEPIEEEPAVGAERLKVERALNLKVDAHRYEFLTPRRDGGYAANRLAGGPSPSPGPDSRPRQGPADAQTRPTDSGSVSRVRDSAQMPSRTRAAPAQGITSSASPLPSSVAASTIADGTPAVNPLDADSALSASQLYRANVEGIDGLGGIAFLHGGDEPPDATSAAAEEHALPASKLLSAFQLEDPDRIPGASHLGDREAHGLRIRRIAFPPRTDYSKPPTGVDMLQHELADPTKVELTTFDLLYSREGYLLAVFPVLTQEQLQAAEDIQSLELRYVEFTRAYFPLPETRGPQAAKDWRAYTRQYKEHHEAIQAYR